MTALEFVQMSIYEGLDNDHVNLINKGECCDLKTFIKEDLWLNPDNVKITVAEDYDADCGCIGQHYIAIVYEDNIDELSGMRKFNRHKADVAIIINGCRGIYLYDLGENE